MSNSERNRLSVTIVDLASGRESEFAALAEEFASVLIRKNYGRADMVRDEANPHRFYSVRYWNDATAAAQCHADADVQALTSRLRRIARLTHAVNGVRTPAPARKDRRVRVEPDRRAGFERRHEPGAAPADSERRSGRDRRVSPRRRTDRGQAMSLVDAARAAREQAQAAFSNFKVGAALEAEDGTVIAGCNIENATYGLTVCAERVAMFKALSEGHRRFTRIAIVADTDAPTPPCGACRQILWEFGGDLEVQLANLYGDKGVHRLRDLLPLPFDARLL